VSAPRYLSTKEAADLIGVGEDLFEDLAEAENWMRPVYIGKKPLKKWDRADVECLAHIVGRRGQLRGEQEA
jgi:hypothetical protein